MNSDQPDDASRGSRFELVSRRAFLSSSGALALVVLAACGKSDKDVLGGALPTTVAAGAGTGPTSSAAVPAVPAGPAFPTGGEVMVNFTFTPEEGRRIRNPYVAVWVEDTAGNLVRTVALWWDKSSEGQRWLRHLTRWDALGASTDTPSSGATRAAGTYSVTWDGADLNGNVVPQGDYVLYIEGAREHGPYELITQPITVGAATFTTPMADSGELTAASVALML
jgi:hypothetical protein